MKSNLVLVRISFGKKLKTVFEMHPFLAFYLYHAK